MPNETVAQSDEVKKRGSDFLRFGPYNRECETMDILNYDARKFFLLGMRLFFGIWLLYAGFAKWVLMGPHTFVGFITGSFDKTWSPHALNFALAWLIMFAEPLLALFILSGVKPRLAWTLTTLLMFLLTMGQTVSMSKDVIANWQYLVLTLVCAALCAPERPLSTPEMLGETEK